MTEIGSFLNDLRVKSEKRFNDFQIQEITTIRAILDKAYLSKPTWVGGDTKFVCTFIDLDDSSKLSFKKHPKVMAKLYDYFTQNIVDVFNHPQFSADYIDIKGDGVLGIFEGEHASFKAFYAALTFKQLFEDAIRPKFTEKDISLSCKIGIHKDLVLVRRIGTGGEGNYNEVWAGRLINNAAKLADQASTIPPNSNTMNSLPILVSQQIYEDFKQNKKFGFFHCCTNGSRMSEAKEMWTQSEGLNDEVLGNKFFYTHVTWCSNCADDYIKLLS